LSRISSLAIRAVFAALLGAGAPMATAEDFEFSVPVQLSKLDAMFTKGTVECRVQGVAHGGAPGAGQATNAALYFLGWGEASFAIAQGKFNDTVVVKFNVPRPSVPSDARAWQCMLSLTSAGRDYQLCLEAPATGSGRPVGIPLQAWMKLDDKALKACVQGTISQPK
jgi:hypothetical protein